MLGLPGWLFGLASAIAMAWDAVNDPYFGYLSDNSRLRWGRRHSFMFIGAMTMGVSFWLYFRPPHGLSTWQLFGWLLFTSLLVRTVTSIYAVPYYALGAELSRDYHERTSISGIRGACGLLGTLATVLFSFVFFPEGFSGGTTGLDSSGYSSMGLAFGLAMTLFGLIAIAGTLSCRPYLPTLDDDVGSSAPKNFFASFIASLRIPSFRPLFFSFAIFFLGTVINAILALHFLTIYMNITLNTFMREFLVSFFIGALVGVGFWIGISKKVEKRRLYFIASLITGIIMSGAFLLFGEGHPLGTDNPRLLLIGHGIAGFFASVLWVLPTSMVADVADEDELATGQRREGSLFGMFQFGEKIATGLSLIVAGFLVDWFAGLVPGQIEQSAETIRRIGMIYSLLPAALVVAAAFLILGYPLNQKEVLAIQAKLAKEHEARVVRCEDV